MKDAADIVANTVRTADRDRYLATLYAPQDKRDALFALYAFNAEIAGVRDRIHEPLPGEVRLQWWRDLLAGSDPAGAAGHPLAEALTRAITDHDLPRQAFDNYLEARIFDLYDDPMPSRTDLEGYCGETASALIQLAAMVLGRDAAPGPLPLGVTPGVSWIRPAPSPSKRSPAVRPEVHRTCASMEPPQVVRRSAVPSVSGTALSTAQPS